MCLIYQALPMSSNSKGQLQIRPFPIYHRRTVLLVFTPGNAILAEQRQFPKYRTPKPNKVDPLLSSNNLDFTAGWYQKVDFACKTSLKPGEESVASRLIRRRILAIKSSQTVSILKMNPPVRCCPPSPSVRPRRTSRWNSIRRSEVHLHLVQ